jgi:hypothetical protein
LPRSPAGFGLECHNWSLLRCAGALLLLVSAEVAAASDQTTGTRPTLSCVDKEPCSIPVVDPTTVYKNLADLFVKGAKEQSCIPLRTLAAAFGINAVADRDRATVRALRDAYVRQKGFGGNTNWPQLIFYADNNGTSRPLDARTIRALVSTELFSRNLELVHVSGDKKTSCVVDPPAATHVGGCLRSATEKQRPSESCKTEAKAIEGRTNRSSLSYSARSESTKRRSPFRETHWVKSSLARGTASMGNWTATSIRRAASYRSASRFRPLRTIPG